MTKELIENIRAIIVPYMAHDLRRINYEKMGEIDAEQFSEDMNEILDLAAKTLEQQPCEDAISRQAAIDALDERFDEIPMEQTTEILLLRKDLRTLPPVQPKYNTSEWCKTCKEYNQDKHCCPRYNNVIRETVEEIKQSKTGHWIKITPSGIYMCSECEQNVLTGDIDVYHYCHHCGIKMIEPQESEG
jgi:DNA-directed RNA polymerase subunit RPC12/RpoP